MNSKSNFSISGLNITLTGAEPIPVRDNFLPFAEEGPADVELSFRQVDELPEITGTEVFRDNDIAVYRCGDRFVRVYHLDCGNPTGKLNRIFASVAYDWETGRGEVQYTAERKDRFADSLGCFAHMGFEDILMSRERLALHASLIGTELGGILFSGVSGIGKSTQADLWHQFEGSPILNGDRPILSRVSGGWRAYGSPFAGSSRYYVNESVPIRAIVLLEQGPDCQLERLKGLEAFCGLYAGTTVNDWNPRYVDRVCTLLEDLVEHVPVYRYRCTADETAVRTLKAELTGGR